MTLKKAPFRTLTDDIEHVQSAINLEQKLVDGSIMHMKETRPSVLDPLVPVKVVLMKLDGSILTSAEASAFLGMLTGVEPTTIKLKRQSTKLTSEQKTKWRRRIERVERLRRSISYMEIRDVERGDANSFIRTDGIGENGGLSSINRYVRITCFCIPFFEHGRACGCSLAYSSVMKYLERGLSVAELQNTYLLAGRRRPGCPLRCQKYTCRAWSKSRSEGWDTRSLSDGDMEKALQLIRTNRPLRFYGWKVALESEGSVQVGEVRTIRGETTEGACNKIEWGLQVKGKEDDIFVDAAGLARGIVLARQVGLDINPDEITTRKW